ncbi:MAG: hypothetical protein J2P55_17195 [Rhizobiales bacterium]|nr:hypothetical protein [Hyphomicrobiales bacterium]
MNDYDVIRAPWSTDEIAALNRYQRRGMFHPFTCPHHTGMEGDDRMLFATRDGWICAHCDYRQDWAHRAMLTAPEQHIAIPCDVILPPATIIRKGCSYDTLLVALRERAGRPPEDCRFNEPNEAVRRAWSST